MNNDAMATPLATINEVQNVTSIHRLEVWHNKYSYF